MYDSLFPVTILPGNPPGQVQPFGPGGGVGIFARNGLVTGQIENLLCKKKNGSSMNTMTADQVKKTGYLQRNQ